MDDNTQYLKDLAEAERQKKQTELDQARAEAKIQQEQAQTKATADYTTQKQQASVQSQLGAKNLAEYWANRGQTSQGISAQAELSRQNTLANSLGAINKTANDYTTQLQQNYDTTERDLNNQLINSNAEIDTNLTTNLYNEKVRQQNALAEQQQAQAEAEQQQFENDLAIANYNLKVNNANSSSSSASATPLSKVGNYKNTTVEYQPGIIKTAIPSGNTTVYQLSNGSTITLEKGVNPFTGTINKDAATVNKVTGKTEYKTFANGYQPNNYTIPTNKWTTASGVAGKNYYLSSTGAKVQINGVTRNIQKVGPTNEYVVYDDTKNTYIPLTTTEKKQAGLIK